MQAKLPCIKSQKSRCLMSEHTSDQAFVEPHLDTNPLPSQHRASFATARIDQRRTSAALPSREAQDPFAPLFLTATQWRGRRDIATETQTQRNTFGKRVFFGFLVTACQQDSSAQSSPETQEYRPVPSICAEQFIPSYILQVLLCPSIPSVFPSMDWTTPIPSFSPQRSCLLNHSFMLFSSSLLFFWPTFELYVLLVLMAVSRKLVQDSGWDLTKLSWVKGLLHPLPYKPQLALLTSIHAWWLMVNLESTTNSSPFLQRCCSAVSHSVSGQPLILTQVYNFVLILFWITFSFFSGDFSTWSIFWILNLFSRKLKAPPMSVSFASVSLHT